MFCMSILTMLAVIITGLLFGSFFNVCIYRIPKNESLVFPSSYCIHCNKSLVWYDLIPVISWILLKAKCRYCNNRIPVRYPIIETATAVVFLFLYFRFGFSGAFITNVILCSLLIVISVIDMDCQIIPNELIVPGTIIGIILSLTGVSVHWTDALFGLLIGGGTYFFIANISQWVLKKEGMGGGDIKLMAMIGLMVGWKLTILSILLSIYLGGLIGGILLVLKIKKRDDTIPFGPIIALGTFISIVFGKDLIAWYLHLFAY